jgi:hypothetical protein
VRFNTSEASVNLITDHPKTEATHHKISFKIDLVHLRPKMKMLWHNAYWDHPLNGVGSIQLDGTPVKVWFTINTNGERIDVDEHWNVIIDYQYSPEIENIIKNHTFDPDNDDLIGSTTEYDIYCWGPNDFTVTHKISYKMYLLPDDVLATIENDYNEAYVVYGYNSWHDPSKYVKNMPVSQDYSNYRKKRETWKIAPEDLATYKCVGIVKYDEIEWFKRPTLNY